MVSTDKKEAVGRQSAAEGKVMGNIDKIKKIISKLEVRQSGHSWWVIIKGLNARYSNGGKIEYFYVCGAPSSKTREEKLAIFTDKLLNGKYTPLTQDGHRKLVLEVSGKFNLIPVDTQTEEEGTQSEELRDSEDEPEQKELFGCDEEDHANLDAKESSSAEEAKFKSTPEEWYIQGYDDGYNKGVATIADPLKEKIHEIQAQLRHDHLREYHAVQLDEIIYILCHELQRAKDLKKSDSDKPRIYAMSGMCDGYNDGVIVTINLVVDKIHEIKCNLKKWDMCDYDADRLYHEVYTPLHRAWQRALELQRMSRNQESLQEDDGEIMTVDEIAKFLKEHDVEFENYGKWFYINHYFGRKYNADELARLIKEHELNAERKGESV